MNKRVTEPLLRLTSSSQKTTTHYGELTFWSCTKHKGNLRDSSNNIHRNNNFVFHGEGPCPSGWTYFKGYCYLVSSSIKTWHKAQAYCKELGGDLVKINSEEENEFVLNLVNKRAPSLRQVWLAVEGNPQRKAFIWADNSIPTFKKWFPGEPNGNAREPCSNFWTRNTYPGINGYWNDLSCSNQNVPCGIVCKRLP